MSAIPFEQVRAAALHQADHLLAGWFPHGRKIGHEFKIGNIRGERGESLSINLTTGRWADFADGISGFDLIDLRAAIHHGGDRIAAARELSDTLGITANGHDRIHGTARRTSNTTTGSDNWHPLVPAPADAPKADFGRCDMVHEYYDAADGLLFYIRRIEARGDKRKIFLPLVYGILDGKRGWHTRHPASPRPLYGLNRLTALPDARVIVCEGEKAADAAQQLFPDHACLSWCGGTGSVEVADFTPLARRRVIVWPDNDADGHKAAVKITKVLPYARILRVDDLGESDDAADVQPDDPDAWLADRLPPAPPPQRGVQYGKLLVLGIDDIDTAPPRDYLLKGLLSPAEISIWVGAPKCGKSFLLLHVAYLLSLGRSVFGRRVKPTKVLYVAAEGEGGIANRIRALRERYGSSADFHFIAQPADLLHHDGHLNDLIKAAKAVGAQLIVLDTLSRLMAGGDENGPQDMGMFICNVTELRYETSAHIAIIHHGTQATNGSKPRGHGSLTGADDALVEVVKLDDGSRVATVVHAKDDADGMRWGFSLEVVTLGTDDDGDPITTLLVTEKAEPSSEPQTAARLTSNEQIALRCFDSAFKASAVMATVGADHTEMLVIHEADWRRWFYDEGKPGETADAKRMAFKRALEGLLAKGIIAARQDLIWLTGRR